MGNYWSSEPEEIEIPEECSVTYDDIRRANQRISDSGPYEIAFGYESREGFLAESNRSRNQVGIYNNEWQRPASMSECAGEGDSQWMAELTNSEYVGEIDFGRNEWARAREAVNQVMDLIIKELKATTKIEGLRVDKYIKQGSSRDGLKVIAPDEFDAMLEFHFEGLVDFIKPRDIKKNGSLVPGVCSVLVSRKTMTSLQERYPQLSKAKVFIETDEGIMVSSQYIYEGVFKSLVDKACDKIRKTIVDYNDDNVTSSKFRIRRKDNPPAINITICLDDMSQQRFMPYGSLRNTPVLAREIDVDIVPALRLRLDEESTYCGRQLNCPIHAVCKWADEKSRKALEFVDQRLVWDVKTTGYEKHIFDVARQSRRELYILTALRIVKAYFTRTKKLCKEKRESPVQLVHVLKSYHLKQITLYLIYFLCHFHDDFPLDSVKEALYYFLKLLEATLEERRLPHFFYSYNGIATQMLPGFSHNSSSPGGKRLRYDLYHQVADESLNRAKQSFYEHLLPKLGLKKPSYSIFFGYGDFAAGHKQIEGLNAIKGEFKQSFAGGEFF